MLQSPVTNSWNGGELSPLMLGRDDTAIYAIGAEAIENFVPCIEGPLQKCPGTERIRAADPSATWFLPFIFDTTQAYVLECGEGKLRFYTNGGRIETDPDTPYEVTVPFAASEWAQVSIQQSYDVLYMAHPNHAPGRLKRTGAETFVYEALDLLNGPFGAPNADETVYVLGTGTFTVGGTISFTAGSAIFEAGHVGGLFQVEAADFASIPAWDVGIDGITAGVTLRRSDGKVYLARSSGRSGTVAPTHDEGQEWDGSGEGHDVNDKGPYGVLWEFQYDRFGVARITSVDSSTVASGTVLRRFPEDISGSSWRWTFGAFSAAEGWPGLVFVNFGRLHFWKRFDLYGSVAGDYLNFQQFGSASYLTDDLAFRQVLSAANPPVWCQVDRALIAGTSGDIWAIDRINSAGAYSGQNLEARRQSKLGCAPVWPVAPAETFIFMERGGRQFREAGYVLQSDRYVANNINRWARHIAGGSDGGIIQLGQQAQTEELLFAVRADGVLVFRTYDPEQEVKGFSRRTLAQGGTILSAVAIPSDDGSRDDIWLLCDWDGAKSVQKMADWWKPGENTIADAFFVDDGASDTLESPSATISDLDWLVGREVAILADGAVLPRQTVPGSGVVTLPFAATRRTIGRPYAARATSLRAVLRDPMGQPSQSKLQRVTGLALRVLETAVSGLRLIAGGSSTQMLLRPSGAVQGAPAPLFTGDTSPDTVAGDWGRDGRYEVVSDDPLPCFVIAAMPRFDVGSH